MRFEFLYLHFSFDNDIEDELALPFHFLEIRLYLPIYKNNVYSLQLIFKLIQMKNTFLILFTLFILFTNNAYSQIDLNKIDLNNINLNQLLGQVMKVQKGYSPQFYIGDIKIPKIDKVAEILNLKQNPEINKLFKTYKTGRTIYKVASYAGTAIAVYGVIKSIDKAAVKNDYQTAFASAIGTIGTGVIVKLLTKGASYKAVDIFNKVAIKSIKDIFKIGMASDTVGVGLYVSL